MKKLIFLSLTLMLFGAIAKAQCDCTLEEIKPSIDYIARTANANPGTVKLIAFESRYQSTQTTEYLKSQGFSSEWVWVENQYGEMQNLQQFFVWTTQSAFEAMSRKGSQMKKTQRCWITPWPDPGREVQTIVEYETPYVPTGYDYQVQTTQPDSCSFKEMLPGFRNALYIANRNPGNLQVVVLTITDPNNSALSELFNMGYQIMEITTPKKWYIYTTTTQAGLVRMQEDAEENNCYPGAWKMPEITTREYRYLKGPRCVICPE